MPDVDVVMIGHFARDRNVVDGVGRIEAGGAVYFGAVALRRLGFAGPFRPDEIPDLAACIYAVTSLKQELPGPWRGSLADVEARLAVPPEMAL